MGEIENAATVIASMLIDHRPALRCLLMPSSDPVRFLVGLYACSRAGVTAVPWRDRTFGLDTICDVVRPDGVLGLNGDILTAVQIDPVDTPPSLDPRAGDLIMLTSGSTGAPKGVVLDLAQVMLNALSAGAVMEIWRCRGWAIDIDMALMSAVSHMVMAWQFDLPLHHLGASEQPELQQIFEAGDIGFGGSPIQLVRLPGRLGNYAPRMVASSGDFLAPAMIEEVSAAFPDTEIHKLYGLTELGGRFCCMPHERLRLNKAAAGFPLPGLQARVRGVDAGEVGEIEAYTPLLMKGYCRSGGLFEPQPRGWFRTGDMGFEGPDGALTVVGRDDDVVKVGGEKVDRHTIEHALSDLLVHSEYCVLGVDHALFGQAPALFIARPASDTEIPGWDAIVTHLKPKLLMRFIPALMYLLPGDIPRLANGKIDRQLLKSSHQGFERLM